MDSVHIWKKIQFYVLMLNPGKPMDSFEFNNFFTLEPLIDYGFDRFKNLLKVKAKTILQICLCHLGSQNLPSSW